MLAWHSQLATKKCNKLLLALQAASTSHVKIAGSIREAGYNTLQHSRPACRLQQSAVQLFHHSAEPQCGTLSIPLLASTHYSSSSTSSRHGAYLKDTRKLLVTYLHMCSDAKHSQLRGLLSQSQVLSDRGLLTHTGVFTSWTQLSLSSTLTNQQRDKHGTDKHVRPALPLGKLTTPDKQQSNNSSYQTQLPQDTEKHDANAGIAGCGSHQLLLGYLRRHQQSLTTENASRAWAQAFNLMKVHHNTACNVQVVVDIFELLVPSIVEHLQKGNAYAKHAFVLLHQTYSIDARLAQALIEQERAAARMQYDTFETHDDRAASSRLPLPPVGSNTTMEHKLEPVETRQSRQHVGGSVRPKKHSTIQEAVVRPTQPSVASVQGTYQSQVRGSRADLSENRLQLLSRWQACHQSVAVAAIQLLAQPQLRKAALKSLKAYSRPGQPPAYYKVAIALQRFPTASESDMQSVWQLLLTAMCADILKNPVNAATTGPWQLHLKPQPGWKSEQLSETRDVLAQLQYKIKSQQLDVAAVWQVTETTLIQLLLAKPARQWTPHQLSFLAAWRASGARCTQEKGWDKLWHHVMQSFQGNPPAEFKYIPDEAVLMLAPKLAEVMHGNQQLQVALLQAATQASLRLIQADSKEGKRGFSRNKPGHLDKHDYVWVEPTVKALELWADVGAQLALPQPYPISHARHIMQTFYEGRYQGVRIAKRQPLKGVTGAAGLRRGLIAQKDKQQVPLELQACQAFLMGWDARLLPVFLQLLKDYSLPSWSPCNRMLRALCTLGEEQPVVYRHLLGAMAFVMLSKVEAQEAATSRATNMLSHPTIGVTQQHQDRFQPPTSWQPHASGPLSDSVEAAAVLLVSHVPGVCYPRGSLQHTVFFTAAALSIPPSNWHRLPPALRAHMAIAAAISAVGHKMMQPAMVREQRAGVTGSRLRQFMNPHRIHVADGQQPDIQFDSGPLTAAASLLSNMQHLVLQKLAEPITTCLSDLSESDQTLVLKAIMKAKGGRMLVSRLERGEQRSQQLQQQDLQSDL